MNILHYFLGFPPFHAGGLMIYAKDLAQAQISSGHKVTMLMPGQTDSQLKESTISFYKTINNLPVYQIINSSLFSTEGISKPQTILQESFEENYTHFLSEHAFDLIHIHSLIALPQSFIHAAKELQISCLFTSHDYYGLCPKVTLFDHNDTHCTDYQEGSKCVTCNAFVNHDFLTSKRNKTFSPLYLRSYALYQHPLIQKRVGFLKKLLRKSNSLQPTQPIPLAQDYVSLREHYIKLLTQIDMIHFNSSVAQETYGQLFDLNSVNHFVEAVTHAKIQDHRTQTHKQTKETVSFAYMGYLDKKKGFIDLVKVLNELKAHSTPWHLSVYGDYSQLDLNDYDSKHYSFKGSYKLEDLNQIFKSTDMLIIPSKWKETFGFIGLEAYSHGVPSLVSSNVGFKDIVKHEQIGLIYQDDLLNQGLKSSLAHILENPNILLKFHQNILKENFTYTLNEHTLRLEGIYKQIILEKKRAV
jgi:glycosyltransferase involved in cell wall biosynthesis